MHLLHILEYFFENKRDLNGKMFLRTGRYGAQSFKTFVHHYISTYQKSY